ncbi:MAG: putative non-ribosomal peptide synthetase [Nocardia sp.]|uniref:condensation domain-containing protein n=1 Tax=Nocardia sp. TaxID=1821 RepID=UPI002603E3C6|nr:condensation domain-containing protein [Nocardia sp.]MCU1640416.1 putative non-ribosomal peptide synthetase [Nocardia sp.]
MTLDTPAVPAAPARSADRGLPLSPAQQAALLPERLARTAAANVYVALEIPAELADGVVARAAEALAAHEILRAVYPDDRRVPYQRVESTPDTAAEIVEIGDTALPAALMADAGHTFDLVRELPIRIRLYRLADHAVLSIAAHPVAADDHTMELLVAALCSNEPVRAPAQYRDFAAEQMKSLAAENDSLTFWKQRLSGLPEQLLLIGERPALPRSARAVVQIPAPVIPARVWPGSTPDALQQVSVDPGQKHAGMTGGLGESDADADAAGVSADPLAVLTALVAGALRELGADTDIPIGVATEARPESAAEVLGNFANYLVLRVDSSRGGAPAQLVADAARILDEARAHAGTRIERLTHQLRGPGGAAKGGLFQVQLAVRPSVLEFGVAGGTAREVARAVARPHGVDLIVDVVATADGWTVTVDLAEALSRRYSAGEFAQLLRRTAETWSAAPDTALDAAEAPEPCDWFVPDTDAAELDPYAISGLGGPPQTAAEHAVAAALREVLELDEEDEVGREDNFFALGGDSVAALRFVTLLAEQGHILDVQKVFEFPAVYEMAESLTTENATAAATAEPAAVVAPMAASGLDAAVLQALAGKLAGR